MRWYHKIAEELLLRTAVINAWLAYKNDVELTAQRRRSHVYSIKTFRETLVYSLLGLEGEILAKCNARSCNKVKLCYRHVEARSGQQCIVPTKYSSTRLDQHSISTDDLIQKVKENRRFKISSLSEEFPAVSRRDLYEIVSECLNYRKLCHAGILLHKWQYFYMGTVADGEPELQNGHQLAAILQAFGESLMQNDITLFSQNLQALEILNLQWKLYQRELFRTQFLPEYLTLLLNTLILKTHALRADEIATAIFNMASVDFETFYLFFLPHFLDHTTGLDSNQRMVLRRNMKADQDLPTFIQNVHRLANDIRCYRLCNGTNPQAS
ncbi:Exportin-6 [Homalodisca vitripennis]|nr:Exportin-6 [Homalodisca vitripennis]